MQRISIPGTKHLYEVGCYNTITLERFRIEAEGNNRDQACRAVERYFQKIQSPIAQAVKVADCNMIG